MDWPCSKYGSGKGSRRRGRPRLRWLEDVQKDLQEMKVKRWRENIIDREEGVSVIKKAKSLRGPHNQEVSKTVSM